MKVYEIFSSINGEVSGRIYQGRMCTFLRLAGCNLKCKYCDTKKSRPLDSGGDVSIKEIADRIIELDNPYITITGGEPGLQIKEIHKLINYLHKKNSDFQFILETNGSIRFSRGLMGLFQAIVMDYKLPSSGMESKMNLENFDFLSPDLDIVKFVIQDKKDFDRALEVRNHLKEKTNIEDFAFSPSHEKLSAKELYNWLKKAKINDAILNVQIHKLIGLR